MIALAFFAGIFVAATVAILLVRGAKTQEPHKTERNLFVEMFDELTVQSAHAERMRNLSAKAPVTDWDVAQAADQDPRVRYEFLNQTGMEDA
jgi:hypothetical protein